MSNAEGGGYDIAVIGMAGRFPGARDVDEFWRNLRNGVESVKFFTDQELLAAGESPTTFRDPDYVKAQPALAGFDQFDAGFFGFSPQDAAVLDPQQRVFFEVGWEALENAGHTVEGFAGSIGVFATCGMNTYMMYNLVNNHRIMETVGEWLVRHTGNDMNFLATRLSYLMNLTGPSMNVQTACSSALVSIHLACQSLLSGECDMVLAGGSTIVLPHNRGYLYKPGEILSPDGHCRPFDAKARGTLFGSGAGVVALRRLGDAQADGDQILAVIKGSAINNDGSSKVGYLAPSVDGQAKAITEALTISGVDPETISYIEMHGTGTIVGDPIEVTALTQAWRRFTDKHGICAIGSLKSNIGHLGEAAGVAAFIKAVSSLDHREMAPTLHYESPNPQIDFAASPFFVNAKLTAWPESGTPRRAGITSLGAGGTNCHLIVEEPPPVSHVSRASRQQQLLLLSARTPTAVATAAENLAAHLRAHPELDLADVAYTLQVGRKVFPHRLAVVCRDRNQAIAALEAQSDARANADQTERPVAFLFPGQGAQFPNMGRGLYQSEPVFRREVDQCAALLKQQRGMAILPLLFPEESGPQAQQKLNQTEITQPALFIIEYALAKLWMSWGVTPRAMIGHSIGEYVAACLAGVFSLADALSLVADRGALMQQVPSGAMLAVLLSEAELTQALAHSPVGSQLSIAALNAPALCVVAGPHEAVAAFEAELAGNGIQGQKLQTSHAFHSAMMEPVLGAFADRLRRVSFQAPSIPYLSNLTGSWIRPEEATDPQYWVRHLRSAVRFSDGVAKLLEGPSPVLLEVGPGGALGGLARQQPVKPAALAYSLGRAGEDATDLAVALKTYGQLWTMGCKLDAAKFYAGQQRRRVALPTYPFERQRYWIDPDSSQHAPGRSTRDIAARDTTALGSLDKKKSIADWFSVPIWQKSLPHPQVARSGRFDRNWLVFLDEDGLGASLVAQLQRGRGGESEPQPLRLGVGVEGDVDSLALVPFDRQPPGAGEVEIRVRAAALNFADVLKATGVFPEAPFGMECAGVIERVGPGVTQFRAGDEVVAIGPESFRSYVVRDIRCVAARPPSFSAEEAVTLPAGFMTAWYSLHHVGKLRRGEKILIHAASGGVGLAAVQVAHLLGAEVFATAGNEEKRAYLKSLGIRHVFDSRSVGFAAEILRLTDGKGVDVALNSLTGEFIPKTFSTLASGGRFLEIGKREILTPSQVTALQPREGVTYHPIDLTRLLQDDLDTYGALLHEIIDLAQAGRIQALTRRVFHCSQAAQAFHLMLQTRHIGKVVLSFAELPPEIFSVRAGSKFRRVSDKEFTIAPGREADYTALLEALEAGGAKIGHIAHLWNVPTMASHAGSLEAELECGFFSLTWLGKALGSRDWSQPLDIAVISTGLAQIAGETLLEPLKATLLGPCRVLPRELSNVSCRNIDIPATKTGQQRDRVLTQLATELATGTDERIVALRSADRWVQRFEPLPLDAIGASKPLRHEGVYLITGGLGGLGLELAEYFARSAKARLILVGRTALPARGEWDNWFRSHGEDDDISTKIRKIQSCEALGGEVLIASADVTDRKRMRAVLAEARKRFGALHGVIHAAGTLDDGLIQLKTAESARSVLAPKVTGALVLDEVLGDTPLDFFVLFSSVSAILGLQGQVDYTAANAFLDAFAESRSARRAGQTVAIDWGAWRDAGMAARAFAGERRAAADPAQLRPRHPWLESRRNKGDEIIFATEFSPARQWVLGEHVLHGGDALIPGTGYLELARAAFGEVDKAFEVEISNVFFQTPFMVGPAEAKELEIALRRDGPRWEFRIQSENGAVTHVTGRLAPSTARSANALDVAAIARRCDAGEEKLDGFLKQNFMEFGPRWGNVRSIRYGSGEALLSLDLPPEFADDLEMIKLHPALLDMATGGAQRLLKGGKSEKVSDFYIPFSYGKLTLRSGFPRKIFSHVRRREGGAQGAVIFDVTVMDERGAVLAEIADFAMKRVADRSSLATQPKQPAAPISLAAALARHIQHEGIIPAEGAAALERILGSAITPRIAASSVDLDAWMKRVDADSAPKVAARTDAPGRGSTAGTATAGSSIERKLAAMYAQILGVASVGPTDDFFALGGHSLLAVRLLARIEKEFGKNIPLPTLFEKPTIEGLAAYLHVDESEAPEREQNVIVPLNEGGTGQAFYCVHSVGGDVMSFRHLARLLGSDQRFFGIQAPPDLRNAEFPSSIEAMAKYYVDALVKFQPEGPYLLGGWSAGSIIALEMACQLEASGRKVDLLVALDGAPFNTGAGTSVWSPLYYWKLARNLPLWIADDLMVDFSPAIFARRVWNKLVSLTKKTTSTLRKETETHGHEVEGFLDTSYFSTSQVSFMKALFAACKAYKAHEYKGPVLLYAAQTQPLYHLLEVELAWATIAPRLTIVPARGTHESIVREPHVHAIAESMRLHLAAKGVKQNKIQKPAAPVMAISREAYRTKRSVFLDKEEQG